MRRVAAEEMRKVAIARIFNQLLFASFGCWADRAAQLGRVKGLMRRALGKELQSRFLTWRDLAVERREMEQLTGDLQTILDNNPSLETGFVRATCRWAAPPELAAAWSTWLSFAEDAKSLHMGMEIAMKYFFESSTRGALTRWRDAVELSRKSQRAMKFWTATSSQRCFLLWAAYLRACRDLKRKQKAAAMHWINATVRSAWDTWTEFTQDRAALRAKLVRSLVHHDSATLRKALQTWAIVAGSQASRREYCAWVFNSLDRYRLQRALETWKETAGSISGLRRNLEMLRGRCQADVMRDCLQRWHSEMHFNGYSRLVLEKAAARMANRALAASYATWIFWVDERRKLARAAGFFRNRVAGMAFRCFEDNWREARAARAVLWGDSAVKKLRLGQWVAFTREAVDEKEKLNKATLKFFGSSLQKAWATWTRQARLMRRVAELMGGSRHKLRQNTLRAWREGTMIAKAHKMTTTHLLERKGGQFKATIWYFMKVHSKAQAHFRRRVLKQWRDITVYYKAQKHKLHTVAQMLLNGFQFRAFNAWRDMALLLAERRERFFAKQAAIRRALAVGDDILRQRKRELLDKCFCHWHILRKKMTMVNARFFAKMASAQTRAFQAWSQYAQARAEKHVKEAKADTHYDARLLRIPFYRWSDAAAKAKEAVKEKLGWAMEHAFMSATGKAFKRWLAYVDTQATRREKLANVFMSLHAAEAQAGKMLYFRAWWRYMSEREAREAELLEIAHEHHRRRMVNEVFNVWVSYTSAMRLPTGAGTMDALYDARRVERTAWDGTPVRDSHTEELMRHLGALAASNASDEGDEDERPTRSTKDSDYKRGGRSTDNRARLSTYSGAMSTPGAASTSTSGMRVPDAQSVASSKGRVSTSGFSGVRGRR